MSQVLHISASESRLEGELGIETDNSWVIETSSDKQKEHMLKVATVQMRLFH